MLKTQCCDVPIADDHRFCPKCGYEARVSSSAGAERTDPEKGLIEALVMAKKALATLMACCERCEYTESAIQEWAEALEANGIHNIGVQIDAALSASQPSERPAPSGWQPMENCWITSKPGEDRRTILVHGPLIGHAFGFVIDYGDGTRYVGAVGYNGDWKITHWMPLPAPPSVDDPVSRGPQEKENVK